MVMVVSGVDSKYFSTGLLKYKPGLVFLSWLWKPSLKMNPPFIRLCTSTNNQKMFQPPPQLRNAGMGRYMYAEGLGTPPSQVKHCAICLLTLTVDLGCAYDQKAHGLQWVESIGMVNKNAVSATLMGITKQFEA
jgi:hypothetical protein